MQIFLKSLGSKNRLAVIEYTIIVDNQIDFSKKPSRISKDNIIICHGVKVGKVLEVCKILESEATRRPAGFDGDRWARIVEKYLREWIQIRWTVLWSRH